MSVYQESKNKKHKMFKEKILLYKLFSEILIIFLSKLITFIIFSRFSKYFKDFLFLFFGGKFDIHWVIFQSEVKLGFTVYFL